MGTQVQTAYGVKNPGIPVMPLPVHSPRAPVNSADISYPQGQEWLDTATGQWFKFDGEALWAVIGSQAGDLFTLTGDSGGAISPDGSGNITLAGTSVAGLHSAGSGSTITFNIDAATTTQRGTAALATNAQAVTGTDAINAVTSASLSARIAAPGPIGGTTPGSGAFTTVSATSTITAGTTLTATLGNITATNGNHVFGTAGNKIVSTSVATTTAAGANSFGSVTLVGGTATVATTAVTAASLIVVWRQTVGATGAAALGQLCHSTISAGTSFIINSNLTADATALATTDVSVVGWMIIN